MRIVSALVEGDGDYNPASMRGVLQRNDVSGDCLVVSGVRDINDFNLGVPSGYRFSTDWRSGRRINKGSTTPLLADLYEALEDQRRSYDYMILHRWDIVLAFSDIDIGKMQIMARTFGPGIFKVTIRPSVVIIPLTTF